MGRFVNLNKFDDMQKYKITYLFNGEEKIEVIEAKSSSNARNNFFKEKRKKHKNVYKKFAIKSIYLVE